MRFSCGKQKEIREWKELFMRKGKEELGISGRNDEKRISQEKYQEKYKRQDLQVNELIAGIGTDL